MENTTQDGIGGVHTPVTHTTFMNKFISVLVMFVVVSLIAYYVFDARGLLLVFIDVVTLIFLVSTVFGKHFDNDVAESQEENRKLAQMPSLLSVMTPRAKGLFFVSLFVWLLANVVAYVVGANAGLVVLCDFMVVFGYSIFLVYVLKLRTQKVMENVAMTLGYTFSPAGDVASLPQYFGTLGDARDMSNVASGVWNNLSVRLFTFHFSTGSGKYRNDSYNTVFEVSTGETFPLMTISPSLAYLLSGYELAIENSMQGLEEVNLEGNFRDSFLVRCASGAQTEIRQVLTPDMMAYLVDHSASNRYMFIDGRVYVVLRQDKGDAATLISQEDYVSFVKSSQDIVGKWLETLKRMK